MERGAYGQHWLGPDWQAEVVRRASADLDMVDRMYEQVRTPGVRAALETVLTAAYRNLTEARKLARKESAHAEQA